MASSDETTSDAAHVQASGVDAPPSDEVSSDEANEQDEDDEAEDASWLPVLEEVESAPIIEFASRGAIHFHVDPRAQRAALLYHLQSGLLREFIDQFIDQAAPVPCDYCD